MGNGSKSYFKTSFSQMCVFPGDGSSRHALCAHSACKQFYKSRKAAGLHTQLMKDRAWTGQAECSFQKHTYAETKLTPGASPSHNFLASSTQFPAEDAVGNGKTFANASKLAMGE
eukprot:1157243-Pelagomonas_calceolata.AAC.5